jgi:hypothetical protein
MIRMTGAEINEMCDHIEEGDSLDAAEAVIARAEDRLFGITV